MMRTRGITPLVCLFVLAMAVGPALAYKNPRLIEVLPGTVETGRLALSFWFDNTEKDVELCRNRTRVNSSLAFCGPKFANRAPIVSYSGHLTTFNGKTNRMWFWWFPVETVDGRLEKPLLVWLDGGPGTSSMRGAIYTNGPVEFNKDATGDDCLLQPRVKGNWAEVFSILYIDNPVGAGYSHTNRGGNATFATTRKDYVDDLYNVMGQFDKMFLNNTYSEFDYYLGGNSYAGKYVPAFAEEMRKFPKFMRKGTLKGLILGSPFFDPPIMSKYIAKYASTLGFIGRKEHREHRSKIKALFDKVDRGEKIEMGAGELFETLVPTIAPNFHPDFVKIPNDTAIQELITRVMESPSMKKAHENEDFKFVADNTEVFELLMQDFPLNVTEILKGFVENTPVLIFNGDHDFIVNSLMIDQALLEGGIGKLDEADRWPWYGDGHNKDLRGFVSRSGNLCRVIIHGAGHDAAVERPEAVLEMVKHFMKTGCIEKNCGNQTSSRRTGRWCFPRR